MDKKSIQIKLFADERALKISTKFGTEIIKLINIIKNNISEFEDRFFYKIYYNRNMFIKNLSNIVYSKKTEENELVNDLIIVRLEKKNKSTSTTEIIKVLKENKINFLIKQGEEK